MASARRVRLRGPAPASANEAAALARRIRDGDAAAESELVDRYRAGLSMLLRRHVKDATLAEDLCHEVFRIALRSLREGKLQDGEKLTAYLWGIARNVARSERRLERRARRAEITEALTDTAPGPDSQLMAAERARLVRRAVNSLGPRDRAVLTAFYLANTSKEAICARLGLSPRQFDLVKWRALKRLLTVLRTLEGRDD